MANKFLVAPAPHVHGSQSTARLMGDVIIALLPALAVSVRVFGWNVLAVTAVSIASCVLLEFLVQRFLVKGPLTINNFSAVVTGLLLAMNLPANIPLWIVVIGAIVAIGVAKMPFGGLGKNPFNPALAARVFLLIAYPVQMTSFPAPKMEGIADAFSGATPLAAAKAQMVTFADTDMLGLFTGTIGGSMGEISAMALLLGGLYLLVRRVITWHIPVAVLGSMGIFAAIYALCALDGGATTLYFTAFHLLAGGAILGAVFMATDYVTSPMTPKGMLIYGVGIGAITMCIRLWGAYPEGMSFAILIMNSVVPLINKYVKPKRFGAR
ncbi:MAG: RnfABCDGE type electron transport complex subunit D [Alistipes sp.]|nr:RnfABCDGE type electron transport complex subunit D [Alistipes sp.]